MFDIEEHLKTLPDNPGVYIMKNSAGDIIYIGKAVSLKNRVRQYFQNSRSHTAKVRAMVGNISSFEYILTDSELEALILECNLIKKHKPKYNILLKDDKHYPYIKVTMEEDYPRIMLARRVDRDNARYFGPYSGSFAVRETIDVIKKLFPVRTCGGPIGGKAGRRPCLNYYIGRCLAPCQGNVDRDEYRRMMKEVCLFLSGNQDELIKTLRDRMDKSSEDMEYERAAEYRDKIYAIKQVQQRQKIISSAMEDEDVIGFASSADGECIQIFFIRGGKLIGREHYMFTGEDMEPIGELLTGFIKQFYSADGAFIPKEILLQQDIDDGDIIEAWLTQKRGSRVYIRVPKRGEKKALVGMVIKNAADTLENFSNRMIREKQMSEGAIRELADALDMESPPSRIEAFDISDIQGTDPVGSMVVFADGRRQSGEYRRFKIKTVAGADDYGSMAEIVERRFRHGLEELEKVKAHLADYRAMKFSTFPDLILIDGGEGQVHAVLAVLNRLGIDIPVCGMVKDDRHRTRDLVYRGKEVGLDRESDAFKLVTRIQDETHRFAITYHRRLRDSGMTRSLLDRIDGIGEKRRSSLLRYFGSIEGIRNAEVDELRRVEGMDSKSAKAVYDFFRGPGNS